MAAHPTDGASPNMSTLLSLRQALGTAVDDLESLKGKPGFKEKLKECDGLEAQIADEEEYLKRQAKLAKPVGSDPGGPYTNGPNDDPTRFKSLGENLQAIMRAAQRPDRIDDRLRAPTGMGEVDPSAGGFPVQIDFAQSIMTRMYDMGEILSRVFKVSISSNANGIKIPGIDETSRATGSRWGGVQVFWLAEGDPGTATKPKFRLIELDLKKMMALWYVTDELMQDTSVLTGIANEAFSQEMVFTTEDAIIRGTGVGMPQGFLNSPATIVVAKESGQGTATLLYQNILKMWSRMWARSRFTAVWFINQDVESQLYSLSQTIGTAGVPVYLPPGGVSEKPYATLMGRPVIPIEYASTLGVTGDIILADLSQYVMADKNAMQQASSIHVRFVNDEMVFRITYRLDGQPIWQAPLTPYQGTQTKSPFIVLAPR